ncbi:MAG: hypothetical protein FWF90_09455 [Promicromonosporaceae bacterium]|nr:hypothetical protein [Promicromonosporaceae bacterium]
MTVVVTDERAPSVGTAGGAGRMAYALAALAAAEQRTGVRRPPAAALPVVEPSPPVESSRRTTHLDAGRVRVHPDLAALLHGGVLPVGGTLAVQGSTSLLLGLLATASHEGAWVAFVGAPAVGMLAAADAGMALERVGLVPDPGADAPTVVAALLDGIDVVVVGPGTTLLDADRRRLAARARERGAVLVSTVRWPGAHVTLDARGGTWWGVDQGAGWLRRRTLSVLRTGRGAAARPVELEVEVPVAPAVPGDEVVSTGSTAGDRSAAGEAPAPALRVVA